MRPLFLILSLSVLGAGSYLGLASEQAPSAAEAGVAEAGGAADAPGAAVLASAPAARPSTSGVRTSVATQTYPVGGATDDEILTSLIAQGPRPDGEVYFGLTAAEISLRYRTVPTAAGCVLADVEVDLTLTVTLPEWTPLAQTPPELSRNWGRFSRALVRHEGRHGEIAERGAEQIVRTLDGLRRVTCDMVQAEAQQRLQRLEAEIEASQHRYDAETGHGRTEGAVWPL